MLAHLRRAATRSAHAVAPALGCRTFSGEPVQRRKSTPLMHSIVLMASGPQDKDILSTLTAKISQLEGNVEESRMTTLGGDFSLLSLLTVPMTVRAETISQEVSDLFPDFTIATRQTSSIPAASEPSKILGIDFEGPDQPNLVKGFSEILYKYKVGIKDLVTDTSAVPFLGYSVFGLKSIVTVPFKTDFAAFEKDLQEFEQKFGLTMAVSDPNDQQQQQDADEGVPNAQIAGRR